MTKGEDEKWMKLAIEEARKAKREGNLPFGAVVVCAGKVISSEHGKENTEQDVTAHAETRAISGACHSLKRKDLSDCIVYASGEPCNMCASAIFQANVPRVVIGISRDELPNIMRPRKIKIEQLAEDCSYKPEIVKGVLRDEVLKLFE
ncbi:MAG: nucleoside deaminase [Candidatus Colwellbacteria bacterium]|nr:nucleoside deaminase [Candidatus Colwellbacteria bacterium]